MNVRHVSTTPFFDQRPGTSGLRKKTRVFEQPNYIENFVQATFDALRDRSDTNFSDKTLVIGGDGRYFNRTAIQKIIRIAAANGFGRVLVGKGGIVSTPAVSAIIRANNAFGGFILSASHNPGGPNYDFGIKYNISNGGPAPSAVTERIFDFTKKIQIYMTTDTPDIDLDREGTQWVYKSEVQIVDPLADYTALMQRLFDFNALSELFKSGFRLCFDAMHASTGPYAHHIFEHCLGAPEGTVIRGNPLEDFGGAHPDPNQVHAHELMELMSHADSPDLGAASDGDGDRNMILGRSFFVTPGDSLAVITEYATQSIPGYRNGLAGVARSMPTSRAVDRVAESLGIQCYEVPTGWKFFGNLMDAGKCTICGEESFGTGSDHVREKDGVWAVLCWLSILAHTRKSVADVVHDHWKKFGRAYYQRQDFEDLDAIVAREMMLSLEEGVSRLQGTEIGGHKVTYADDFCYTDPVDGSKSTGQGIRILLEGDNRVVCRLSGTGTQGATLRLYLEGHRFDEGREDVNKVLAPIAASAKILLQLRERFGTDEPTVTT